MRSAWWMRQGSVDTGPGQGLRVGAGSETSREYCKDIGRQVIFLEYAAGSAWVLVIL